MKIKLLNFAIDVLFLTSAVSLIAMLCDVAVYIAGLLLTN